MKRSFLRIVASLTGVLLLSTSSRALSDDLAMDGHWWKKVPNSAKVYVVQGMITAYQEAYSAGYTGGVLAVGGLETKALSANQISTSQFDKIDYGIVLSVDYREDQFTKTIGAYVREINDFYTTHPNAISAPVGYVLRCIVDKPLISCKTVAANTRGPK